VAIYPACNYLEEALKAVKEFGKIGAPSELCLLVMKNTSFGHLSWALVDTESEKFGGPQEHRSSPSPQPTSITALLAGGSPLAFFY